MQKSNNNLVLCKDCKHSYISFADKFFSPGSNQYYYKCMKNHKAGKMDENYVTGPKFVPAKFETCSLSRLDSQPCGVKGKLWEPKNKKDLFIYMKRI